MTEPYALVSCANCGDYVFKDETGTRYELLMPFQQAPARDISRETEEP